jgi:hypothetical protein
VKAYRGSGGAAPFILNLRTRLRLVVYFTPLPFKTREGPPLPVEEQAGWAPEPVWTIWKREQSLALSGIRMPSLPVRVLVSVPLTLSRLPDDDDDDDDDDDIVGTNNNSFNLGKTNSKEVNTRNIFL